MARWTVVRILSNPIANARPIENPEGRCGGCVSIVYRFGMDYSVAIHMLPSHGVDMARLDGGVNTVNPEGDTFPVR
jgi:hypothetical protein